MHEATVALAILKRAVETIEKRSKAEEGNADRKTAADDQSKAGSTNFHVTRIVVNIGEFRNVDPESLDFAFSALRKDFILTSEAILEIRRIDGLASCSPANHHFRPDPNIYFACTVCGGGIDKFISGKELDIVSIEIEERTQVTAA